ncbi:carboxylic ester hydrolase-like [Macrosteles quadrilineatus]|uniref:carboxylic ester hydrolase-like n=1 Tax=Macrosteles quadrilineatus TaxID=74068 RepID=UPI0023E230A9|nr:carboxylic ester hydrolase-like [Macrosteles quadrilineatus]
MAFGRRITSTLFLILFLAHGIQADNETDENSPIVETSLGPVQGFKYTSSWTKKPIYAFRGIPYAAPPVGNLRFNYPVPPESWTSVRNCSEDQPSCMQNSNFIIGHKNITFEMSEDCLYLNVHSPVYPKKEELLPVMVWVHGGAFIEGSGSYFRYGPDILVGEGVIVVTLNYRLGALGFLTLDTPDIPGNAGLKDQMCALRWVQREIRKFGGNPNNVTLFGESAGSASVHLHYLSPLAKGLFQRVIGESGTALGDWAVTENGQAYGKALAKMVNCTYEDLDDVSRCLLLVNAEDIVSAQQKVPSLLVNGRKQSLVFIPNVDKNSPKPFLPEIPTRLIELKQGSFVPFIMGINSDEGMMMLRSKEQIRNITNNLDQVIPYSIVKKCNKERLKLLTDRLNNFYFKEPPSEKNLRGYVDMFTDQMFGYSTAVSARVYRERAPVYLYYFAFNGKFKEFFVKFLENKFTFSGVSHAEELSYLFERDKVNQEAEEDSDEMKTWRRMARMWTNFAKFGTPTVEKDPVLEDVEWKPVGKVMTNYLLINNTLKMVEQDFLAARVALWDTITPSSSSHLYPTCALVLVGVAMFIWLSDRSQN